MRVCVCVCAAGCGVASGNSGVATRLSAAYSKRHRGSWRDPARRNNNYDVATSSIIGPGKSFSSFLFLLCFFF